MPKAKLPTSARGWFVALVGSFVGFIAGFFVVDWLSRVMGE